jgi:hypothetical protein
MPMPVLALVPIMGAMTTMMTMTTTVSCYLETHFVHEPPIAIQKWYRVSEPLAICKQLQRL